MIGLTTGLLMFASAFTGITGTSVLADQGTPAAIEQAAATTTVSQTLVSTEAYVNDYFKDTPILAEVARCESTYRQFGTNGNVITGKVDSDDIGVMQINKFYQGDNAAKLGFDIYTIDGNLGYAQYLYGKYGTAPWSSSEKCWKPAAELARS